MPNFTEIKETFVDGRIYPGRIDRHFRHILLGRLRRTDLTTLAVNLVWNSEHWFTRSSATAEAPCVALRQL